MVDTHTSNLSAGSGYWGQAATWSSTGGGIPTAGDSVIIAATDTVYCDIAIANRVSLAALTVTGTLRFVTATVPANGAVQSTNPATRVGLGLLMADAASITGAGALYVGNSTTDYIARPTAAATYVPNATITLGTTGVITVTTQRYYGWVPATPSIHPAWTQITGTGGVDLSPPLVTEYALKVAASDFDVIQGEKILIGVGGTNGLMGAGEITTPKGTYTVNAAPTIVGSALDIVSTEALGTSRVLNDIVAIHSRPILITKPAWDATRGSAAGTIMQGVRLNNMSWGGTNSTYKGVTMECNVHPGILSYSGAYGNTYNDVVMSNNTGGYIGQYVYNEMLIGCVGVNMSAGFLATVPSYVLNNCAIENSTFGVGSGNFNGRISGCKIIQCGVSFGDVCTNLDVSNCATSGSGIDLASAASTAASPAKLYNTTLGSNTPVATGSLTDGRHPTWGKIQSRKTNGVVGYRACWCKGGTGTTYNVTPNYGAAYSTMQFVVGATATPPIPFFWDTEFFLPPNRMLTFDVPMYKAAGDTGVTAELWIFEPGNDPLFADQFWQLSATYPLINATAQCSPVATYIIARSTMPDVTGAWQQVTITVPTSAEGRRLIARIIVKGTTVNKNLYAYLDGMEQKLMRRQVVIG